MTKVVCQQEKEKKRPLRVTNERIAFSQAKGGRLMENSEESLLPRNDHLVNKGNSGPNVSVETFLN